MKRPNRPSCTSIALICLTWLWASLGASVVQAADGAGLITVDVQTLTPVTSLETKATFSGIVKPKRRSELSFERAGRVDAIDVEQGDRVTQGQVLAKLNTEQLVAQIRKLEADRRAAEAVLDELKAGPRQETIDAARAQVREQEVQLEQASSSLARRQRLIKDRLIPREELEQAETAVARWDAMRQAAQKRLEDLELGTRSEKLLSQQASIESIEAAIAAANVELDHSIIRSPYAGSIVDRSIDEGYVVSSGRPVFVISEDAVLQAHFGVPPGIAGTLEIGRPLSVLIRDQAVPAKLKAVVAQVDDSTRSQEVIATLEPMTETRLIAGDVARLELTRTQSVDGFWLDTAAVMQGQRGLWECYVIEPEQDKTSGIGLARRRAIEILQTEGDRVLVRGALRAGDRVVISAVHRLSAGQRVRPIEKAAP